MITKDQVSAFCANPVEFLGNSNTSVQTQPKEYYEELQLEALKLRFEQFRDSIPMVKKLADKQAISNINTLDDIVPLLFDHTMYKSYPPSLLHNGRFDQLTKWLNKLTAHDLSQTDVSSCKSIDEWLETLDKKQGLLVCHTSGTSGTFSFIPKARADWEKWLKLYGVIEFQRFGEENEVLEAPYGIDVVYPYYRSGALSHVVINEAVLAVIAGSEEKLHCAFPSRLSADVTLLAARIHAAKAKGTLDRLEIPEDLLARREEFLQLQQNMGEHLVEFIEEMGEKLKGKRIFLQIAAPTLHKIAKQGLAKGNRGIFAANSVIITGGGGKGIVLPDDWQETVKKYLGVNHLNLGYGMTEMSALFPLCSHNRYHLLPWAITFLLDPDTGQPLPRKGEVTGRFAVFDLLPDTYWGGFISGDEVTIDWDTPCGCGRTTPHMASTIQRYSEKTGEEDKISCAASPDAYEEAMDFLGDITS